MADPTTAGTLDTVLNAAAVGAYHKDVVIGLYDDNDNLMTWYSGPVTLVPTEIAVDENILVPTITGGNTVQLVDGEASVEVVYDTDAGATKTYAVGDKVGFTVAALTVLGESVDVSGGGFLDTVTTA